MKAELVTVVSRDKLELPALLFAPIKAKKVAIYLHGNGDSGVFYNQNLINALAEELSKNDIGLLALNNRGARYKKKLIIHDSGEPGQEETDTLGVHYELIEDCMMDLDGAIDFLESKGFTEFYALGFSTGANKICNYEFLAKNDRFSKHVLAGPGDDSGLFHNILGERRFNKAIKLAEKYIKNDKPTHIMPKYSGMNPWTAQSAVDMIHPDGPYNNFPYFEATQKRLGTKELFKEYKSVKKPMLVVFGSEDEFTHTGGGSERCLALLQQHVNKKVASKSKFTIIKNADHGFHGYEVELASQVSKWLAN